jgi:hypothetical protein
MAAARHALLTKIMTPSLSKIAIKGEEKLIAAWAKLSFCRMP